MATFNNLDALLKHLQAKVAETLQDEVANDVSDKMKEHYMNEVYDYDYNEEFRTRRMSLVDDANIDKTLVGATTLSVSNTAKPDDSVFGTPIYGDPDGLLAQWIEDGNITNVFNNHSGYPWTKPRPVIHTTAEEIRQKKSHIKAMKQGLKKRGVDVK